MKKWWIVAIVLFTMVFILSGCGASSTIEGRVFDIEGAVQYRRLLDADLHSFAFDYQEDIQGTVTTLEVWQNGICTETYMLGQGRYAQNETEEYYFIMERVRDEAHNWVGMELQSLSYASDGKMAAHALHAPVKLHFPSCIKSYAYGFVDDKLKVKPGNTYILGFWDMDLANDGHTDISIDSLNDRNSQEVIQKSEYIIILKEQLFSTVEEAEALSELYFEK